MFLPFDPAVSTPEREQARAAHWRTQSTFHRSVRSRHPHSPFHFFDGPPFATGLPHYGHILAGTIKDVIPRFRTMQGYRVDRQFGWDCHGVPVEYQVEKEHQIGGKPGIEALGIDTFNELCRDIVLRCASDWRATVDRMGRFIDTHDDYKTMQPQFMESVWWVFGQLWAKGLIYEGYKVVAYSPTLGSPLSNFEANLNYADIDDPAVTVSFPFPDGTHALAWTTTPWTLPANVGLGFGRDLPYALVDHDGTHYWVAQAAVERLFGPDATILRTQLGHQFLGQRYTPLFDFYDDGTEQRFICIHDDGDYVSTDAGTGIVHFAPTFGAEDDDICRPHNLYGVMPIDESGYFNSDIPPLSGQYFRHDPKVDGSKDNNANAWVINTLKTSGRLFRREQIRHSYPHCWRTDAALMYRAINTWYVDIQTLKPTLLEQAQNINWVPSHLKDGRFGKGLEGAPDWAISRNRYWGTPIPIWRCDQTGHIEVITSIAQLESRCGQTVTDLHRHFIDHLTWPSPSGGTMRRIPEVLDCWFESGSMPYASQHYPFRCLQGLKNRYVLIRHGQATNNTQRVEASSPTTQAQHPLTELGFEQAQTLVDQGFTADIIVSSPYLRTHQTATVLSQDGRIPLTTDDRLVEIDSGQLDGQSYDVVKAHIAQHSIVSQPFPDGESIQQCQRRVTAVIHDLESQHEGKTIAIVSHATPLHCIIDWYNDTPTKWWGSDLIDNCTPIDLRQNPYRDFPAADFIAEGLDQTRCWFYNLHVLGCALFGKNIYKNVITNGIVLAADGAKMSKSKQNYPDPNDIFAQYGADAVRLYLLSSPVVRGENFRFAESGVQEVLKSILLPLQNAYKFFSTYANIDGWSPHSLTVVRHGEAQHNVAGIYSGLTDTPHELTDEGIAQVKATAQQLRTPDLIIASPLVRTRQTAQLLADELKYSGEIIFDDRLREADFGDLEGQPYMQYRERLAHPTAERPESIAARTADFYHSLAVDYPDRDILVVGHGDTVRGVKVAHYRLYDFYRVSLTATGQHTVLYPAPPASANPLDQWILSALESLTLHVTTQLESYQLDTALKPLAAFIDDLTNWYIRRSRRRFWAHGLNPDKVSAYQTLHHVLYRLTHLLAPFAPFLSDDLFLRLGGHDSVHLQMFPVADQSRVNPLLEQRVSLMREVVGLAAGIRARAGVRLRQPLPLLQFALTQPLDLDLDVIAAEANVKDIQVLDSVDGLATEIVKVNAKKVGKKFGKKTQTLIQAGKSGDFTRHPDGTLTIAGETIMPDEYDRAFLTAEGVEAASTHRLIVLLDTTLTPALEREGLARDFIRTVQDLRKSSHFAVEDHITLHCHTTDDTLTQMLSEQSALIQSETLADQLTILSDPPADAHTVTLAEGIISLSVSQV